MRSASSADLDAILRIEEESFSDPWSRRSFADVLRMSGAIFLVAVNGLNGAIRGYVIATAAAAESEILNLAVAFESRGCGLGGELLDAAIATMRARGVRSVFLEVRESNYAGQALYRARGFAEVGRRTKYYRSPAEDALVLARAL